MTLNSANFCFSCFYWIRSTPHFGEKTVCFWNVLRHNVFHIVVSKKVMLCEMHESHIGISHQICLLHMRNVGYGRTTSSCIGHNIVRFYKSSFTFREWYLFCFGCFGGVCVLCKESGGAVVVVW
jgi:hypothetical protein